MSFTDEDLKRLKAFRLQGYHTWTAFEQNEIVDLVDALIARLEAAEKLICLNPQAYPEKFEDAMFFWRKACGK